MPLLNGLVNLVQQIHQDLVLSVDLLDTDAQFIGPFDESAHGAPREIMVASWKNGRRSHVGRYQAPAGARLPLGLLT
jgi:hypothetical protein